MYLLLKMLDSKHYVKIQSKTVIHPTKNDTDITYTGYKSKFSCPLILFSETDNTPLFLLEILYKNKSMYNNNFTLFSNIEYNNQKHFQAMLSSDKCDIEFVVTNLTNDWLSFNIFCDNKPVNTINVLKGHETVSITSDVSTKKNLIFTACDNKTTLKDDIDNKRDGKKEEGMNLSIVINPEIGSDELFKSTFWKPCSYFITKSESTKYSGSKKSRINDDYFDEEAEEEGSAFDLFNPFDGVSSQSISMKSCRLVGINTIGSSLKNATYDIKMPVVEPKNILNSVVGKIITGNEIVNVDTESIDVNINYEIQSKCYFKMVLLRDFVLKNNYHECVRENVKDGLDECVKNLFTPLLKNVFNSDTCVACLEEKTNMIIYSCGHSCLCGKCCEKIDKCPLCREVVFAFVKK